MFDSDKSVFYELRSHPQDWLDWMSEQDRPIDLKHLKLTHINPLLQYSSATMYGLTFLDVDFTGSDFSSTIIQECRFHGCVFDESNFTKCHFLKCELNGCTFKNVTMDSALFGSGVFSLNTSIDSSWRGVQFMRGELTNCTFTRCDLTKGVSYLASCDLFAFPECNLRDFSFFGTQFKEGTIILLPHTDRLIFKSHPNYVIHLQHHRVQCGCADMSIDDWMLLTDKDFELKVDPSVSNYAFYQEHREALRDVALSLPPYPEEVQNER